MQTVVTNVIGRAKPDNTRIPHESILYDEFRLLGFKDAVIEKCLNSFAPSKSDSTDPKRTFQAALLHFLSLLTEKELPTRFNRSQEVSREMKRQEDKNVSAQSALLQACGDVMGLATRRLERFGYPRMRCICALHSVKGDYLEAAKLLIGDLLPLELEEGVEDIRHPKERREEIDEEVECCKAVFGDERVDLYRRPADGALEIQLKPEDSQWKLTAEVAEFSTYPYTAPFLFPVHPNFPKPDDPQKFDLHAQNIYLSLLKALGDVCRDYIGQPMLLALTVWLAENGELYLKQLQEASIITHEEPDELEDFSDGESDNEPVKDSTLSAGNLAKTAKDKFARDILLAAQAGENLDKTGNMMCDLSGYTSTKVDSLVQEAFSNPLLGKHKKAFKVGFIVGGGKQIRGKYDDQLPRWLSAALTNISYKDDKSASSSTKGTGYFKMQHNTSTNEKVIYVFPLYDDSFFESSGTTSGNILSDPHRLVTLGERKFRTLLEQYANSDLGEKVKIEKVNILKNQFESFIIDYDDIYKKLCDGKKLSGVEQKFFNECGASKAGLEERLGVLNEVLLNFQGETQIIGGELVAHDISHTIKKKGEAITLSQSSTEGGKKLIDESWLAAKIALGKKTGHSSKLQKLLVDRQPESMKETRQNLPVFNMRQEFINNVRNNQVVVVMGATGCGKSTQLPQYILEDMVAANEGAACNIIMTQPRRISAVGVAERMAAETGTNIGGLIGYHIRLERKAQQNTNVTVMTTGVLLRKLEQDPGLTGVTHVLVDEVHERSLDTDFLLIILRDLLPRRPNLKIVLMSATIALDIFTEYFSKACSSSAQMSIPGRTFPVKTYFLEQAIQHTAYKPSRDYIANNGAFEPEKAEKIYYNDQIVSLDAFKQPPKVDVLKTLHDMDLSVLNIELIEYLVRHIHNTEKMHAAVLVFLAGFAEIKKVMRQLESSPVASQLLLVPVHSMMSVEEQKLVFKKPPKGMRKIVLATNIAETSITVEDVEIVIDSGRHKQMKFDPAARISMLVDCAESKANARQRRGRAGRVRSGICYHLFNASKWVRMDDYEKPEMQRAALDQICLEIQLLGLGHPLTFLSKAIDPPSLTAVTSSLRSLADISAVTVHYDDDGGGKKKLNSYQQKQYVLL